MDLTVSHCFLYASNQDRSLEFYRDVLGFQVTNDVQFEQMRWLSLASPAQPGLEIVLETPDANPNISASDVAAMQELLAKGYLNAVIFRTAGCDALFERVSASGGRGDPGADRPAVRGARLRLPRPGRQPGAVQPADNPGVTPRARHAAVPCGGADMPTCPDSPACAACLASGRRSNGRRARVSRTRAGRGRTRVRAPRRPGATTACR